jgi:hypothetical protein
VLEPVIEIVKEEGVYRKPPYPAIDYTLDMVVYVIVRSAIAPDR